MDDNAQSKARIEGNDIIFNCEHCGHSLAIDIKGAGLKQRCPECGEEIIVPIPEGIELSDIDSHLDDSSLVSEEEEANAEENSEEISALLTELEELRFRAQFLEKKQKEYHIALQNLSSQIESIREALKEMDDVLDNLEEKRADDTQAIT
jgi:transcription elongation factor Elf1